MRYSGVLAIILFLSSQALADMAAVEGCQKEGDVAKKASNLRIADS